MNLAPGVNISPNVRLVSQLDAGGMGAVWIAEHLALEIRVAVKFILAELARDVPDVVARFEREAKMAAQINSPHVVKTFDLGSTDDGMPYIVMELLRGNTLGEWLEMVGPLSVLETAMVVKQTTSALVKAHELGVIHRDIKPANLFLLDAGPDLFVKVLDFGIAKNTNVPSPSVVTNAGTLMGTPDFMSPEHLLDEGVLGPSNDFWSLAVVAYRAMTGCLPFLGDTLPTLVIEITSGRFLPPSAVKPNIPGQVDEWFARALARDPADRFESGGAMAAALEEAAGAGRLSEQHTLRSIELQTIAAAVDQEAPKEGSEGPDWVGPLALPIADQPPTSAAPSALALLASVGEGEVSRARWDVLFDGSEVGPVTTKLLLRGLETGSIPRTVKVRKTGSTTWVSIGDAPTLQRAMSTDSGTSQNVAREILTPTPSDPGHLQSPSLAAMSSPSPSHEGQARPSSAHLSPLAPARGGSQRVVVLAIGMAAILLVVLGLQLGGFLSPPAPDGLNEPEVGGDTEQQQLAQGQRSCEAARKQIYGGASLPADVDGWVVELWLARAEGQGTMAEDPVLKALVSHERLAPGSGHALDVVEPGAASATIIPGVGRDELGATTAVVRMTGGYVTVFLSPAGRVTLERLAARVAQASKADFASLYGKCAHLEQHDIGAWYGGRGSSAAVAALMVSASTAAQPATFDRKVVAGEAGLLRALQERAGTLKRNDLDELLAGLGGKASGEGDDGLVELRFAIGGPRKAHAASRALAQALELGDQP
jgi:serine/threonine protein kinase